MLKLVADKKKRVKIYQAYQLIKSINWQEKTRTIYILLKRHWLFLFSNISESFLILSSDHGAIIQTGITSLLISACLWSRAGSLVVSVA